jgi:hypothetical protein
MPTNFPTGISNRGVPVEGYAGIGSPLFTSGNVYWVDSGADTADDDNAGTNPKQPLATVDGAVNKTTANNGDVIVVKPGHSETISAAAGIVFDVAGVTVIGQGVGNSRPTITLDTAATADIDVSAADVRIYNMIFSMNYADIVQVFDLSADGFTLDGCDIVDTAVNMNFVDLIKCTTTDNECDRITVNNCYIASPDTGNDAVVEIGGDSDRLTFTDNYIRLGVSNSEAVISVATGKDVTNCLIAGNYIYRLNSAGDLLIDSDTSDNSGIIAHNRIGHADTSGEVLVDADGVRQFDNTGTATDTASGYPLPAIDS